MQMIAIPTVTIPDGPKSVLCATISADVVLTFDNEQPLPAMHAILLVKRGKGCSSDQTSECDSENVARVQDGDTGGDLLACVEQGEDVQGTWVEGSLDESKEESNNNQSCVVLDKSGQGSDDTPDDHTATHVDAGSDVL